jgi:hypothetical protein
MQYKPIENYHMENAVLGKDLNLSMISSFFHAFTLGPHKHSHSSMDTWDSFNSLLISNPSTESPMLLLNHSIDPSASSSTNSSTSYSSTNSFTMFPLLQPKLYDQSILIANYTKLMQSSDYHTRTCISRKKNHVQTICSNPIRKRPIVVYGIYL